MPLIQLHALPVNFNSDRLSGDILALVRDF